MVVIANTEPEDKYKGVFVLDIERMRTMNWLDSNNELTKDICVNALLENLEDIQRNKIDPKALKKALDEIDALEGSK